MDTFILNATALVFDVYRHPRCVYIIDSYFDVSELGILYQFDFLQWGHALEARVDLQSTRKLWLTVIFYIRDVFYSNNII